MLAVNVANVESLITMELALEMAKKGLPFFGPVTEQLSSFWFPPDKLTELGP
jgi:hypothetical protein